MTPREKEILGYAQAEVKSGLLKNFWYESGKFYAESEQGIFLYWQEEQEQNPSTVYGE